MPDARSAAVLRRQLRRLEARIDPARFDPALSRQLDQLIVALERLERQPSLARESSRRAEVYARDHGICARCGRNAEAAGIGWEADHVLPVADGGGESPLENLRTLCRPCHIVVTAEWRPNRRNGWLPHDD
jgi:5-methylcytosine-specific restriction endonuclease McrA